MKNPLLKRLFVFLLIVLFLGGLFYFSYIQLSKKPDLYFVFDNTDFSEMPSDLILHNYEEYKAFVKKYNVNILLTKESFKNNYYVASFQEYDGCRENNIRKVDKVHIDSSINIIYKIDNKCGWCKSKILLYLVEIDKINNDLPIKYDYIYKNKLECEL